MALSTSSIPVVTDTFLVLLAAATWPGETPMISDSDPDTEPREIVIVGDSYNENESDQDWFTFGKSRQEVYDLRLNVIVTSPGLTQKAARDRAFELFAVVEFVVAADPLLGLTPTDNRNVMVAAMQQPRHSQPLMAEGHACVIHSALRVRAQINPASGV